MITSYQSNRIMNRDFGATSASVPSNWFVGLSTTPMNFDGTGATEPVAGAYARVQIANDKVTFGVAALGIILNLISVTFVESTASWGTITYVGFWDTLTTGNLAYFEALPVSRAVPINTTVLFAAGAISLQMNNT